jgi:uncharacterized OsmC-like protein
VTSIQVRPVANNRYEVVLGRHCLTIDQPVTAGGDDEGPTAVQLFVASLVACTAHYAGSYLARHGLSTDGLIVEGDFLMASDGPGRVASVSVRIVPPAGLPEGRRAVLLAVASHCTVHHTLREPPTVTVVLAGSVEPGDDRQLPHERSDDFVGAIASCSSAQSDPRRGEPREERS